MFVGIGLSLSLTNRLPQKNSVVSSALSIGHGDQAIGGRNPRDLRDSALGESELQARLAHIWGTRATLWGWLTTVDHKAIGRRYIITAFIFLFLGGILAAFMRGQLARAEAGLIGPDLYNQIFTVHGSTMMFRFAVHLRWPKASLRIPLNKNQSTSLSRPVRSAA